MPSKYPRHRSCEFLTTSWTSIFTDVLGLPWTFLQCVKDGGIDRFMVDLWSLWQRIIVLPEMFYFILLSVIIDCWQQVRITGSNIKPLKRESCRLRLTVWVDHPFRNVFVQRKYTHFWSFFSFWRKTFKRYFSKNIFLKKRTLRSMCQFLLKSHPRSIWNNICSSSFIFLNLTPRARLCLLPPCCSSHFQ